MLDGVNVALGVTGSIAAVKTVELAHELRRQGAEVRAVMTDAATGIVHPWSLEYATENPVVTEITGAVEHVELCGREGWADVLLVAPTTANTVGKMAAAIDDSPVTTCATTAFGAALPVVVVPAMHEPMYDHPGVVEALDSLAEWGVDFVDPRIEEGKAKIATEEAIVTATARVTGPSPLEDETVVVTSGATTESIDPIRTLSNRSSGRTGRAVAQACATLGAEVVLVHDGPEKPWAQTVQVESAAEMVDGVLDHASAADVLVSAAAISDYTVETAATKIRSGKESLTLDLEATPKLIDTVRETCPDLPIVGFKAETDDDRDTLLKQARKLQDRAGLSFVVGNNAAVMGQDRTEVLIVDGETTTEVTGTKQTVGQRIGRELAERL